MVPSLRDCDGLLPLPVKEKAFPGLPQALPKCPRASQASKSSQTYQHRSVFPQTLASFQNRISPYKARRITRGKQKRALFLDRHAENTHLGPMLRAYDGLLPLPVQEKSLPRSPPSASEVASGLPKSPPGAAEVPSGFRGFGSSQAYQHRSAFLRTLANFRNRIIRASETG